LSRPLTCAFPLTQSYYASYYTFSNPTKNKPVNTDFSLRLEEAEARAREETEHRLEAELDAR
jgi:hypothetical protein